MSPCSPRPRGWSRRRAHLGEVRALLPAPAGMVPGRRRSCCAPRSAPRARGDGPSKSLAIRLRQLCSPRPRGWSRRPVRGGGLEGLLPAPAGMVPSRPPPRPARRTAPRARGDGPITTLLSNSQKSCSPRPRGWSPDSHHAHGGKGLLPAPAGMVPRPGRTCSPRTAAPRARGDGPTTESADSGHPDCSPRPRGWSQPQRRVQPAEPLLPAPAGMVPSRYATPACTPSAPRARGDGPVSGAVEEVVLDGSPRPRGWSLPGDLAEDRLGPAPRARGDGPDESEDWRMFLDCSPRPRGWSRPGLDHHLGVGLLPAPAGMVPASPARTGR